MFKCYVTDMDTLCRYSEEVDKVTNINNEHETSLLVREEDCILDFTTDEVK